MMPVNRSKKQLIFVLLLLFGILLIGIGSFSLFVKWKVARLLSYNIPDPYELSYTGLQVYPLRGNVEVKDVLLSRTREEFAGPASQLEMEAFTVVGFSFWKFLLTN